jgi:hypothetical protein
MKTLVSLVLLLSVSILLSLNSCSNSTEPLETNNIDFEIPIVPGLILTAENDPTPIGIWRNPHLPNGGYQFYGYYGDNIETEEPAPINIRLHTPYPNPTNSSIKIQFALSIDTKISLWLVRAKLPEDNYNNIKTTSGGVFVSSNSKIVLLKDIQKNAGVYQVSYDWTNEDGEYFPAGFYRIYFKADGHTLWCDVLIARKITDLPPDLRGKVLFEN